MKSHAKLFVGLILFLTIGTTIGVGTASAQTGDDPLVCNGMTATIIGTDGDDVLSGTTGPDVIVGLGGNDVINALAGDDVVCGGGGRDRIWAGAGADTVFGGDAIDYVWGGRGEDTLHGGPGSDRLRGGDDNDTMNGGAGADRLWGNNGFDTIHGGDGQDTIWGGPDRDVLRGDAQSDTIRGGPGDDSLWGDGGKDALFGGKGSDVLNGGNNSDTLFGGPGSDRLFGDQGRDALFGGLDSDQLDGGAHTDTCHRGVDVRFTSCQLRPSELSDYWVLTEIDRGDGAVVRSVSDGDRTAPYLALDTSTARGSIVRPECSTVNFAFSIEGATMVTSGGTHVSDGCAGTSSADLDSISERAAFEYDWSTLVIVDRGVTFTFARMSEELLHAYITDAQWFELPRARARWEAAVAVAGENYEMDHTTWCFFCPPFLYTTVVSNGEASFSVDTSVAPDWYCCDRDLAVVGDRQQLTVPELFRRIEEALELEARRLEVTYGEHGVPIFIAVDYTRGADDEISHTVLRFEFVNPPG